MPFEIFDSLDSKKFDRNKLYCAGSVTKFLTTFVVLSFLGEKYAGKYKLSEILDDDKFFDTIATDQAAKDFLKIIQKNIVGKFSLRDLCTYYTGLPYTFDPTQEALERVDQGKAFKHHSVMEEKEFLSLCETQVTPLYPNRKHFHYSELSIIFMAYLIEKIFKVTMEELYIKYLQEPFKLKQSQLSRVRPKDVFVQELSDKYDYAAVAVQDHGFFCYSNGFYTTLNELQLILDGITVLPVFQQMIDVTRARASAENVMNGLAVELRMVGDDLVYGYEGLSFSGCNIWSYSRNLKKGYMTFCQDESAAYQVIYAKFGYDKFDPVPKHALAFCSEFITNYSAVMEAKEIPVEYQGKYRRVKINDGVELTEVTTLGNNFLELRDPEPVQYDLMYRNQGYYIKTKNKVHDAKISLYQTKANRYMFYNGSLYKRFSQQSVTDQTEAKTAIPEKMILKLA